ncbi:MAG: hypothetical protein N4A48_09270 [Tepidibacter sp.]|jgi:hypothetical protein|uniref:hypothetical protein n=1 Tax=Tepidibacter sp. TaxID=2529387 RepID=UPI0025D0C058|nr:hypothetical protein [Tepidibacter sp.]MCT4508936.1 hypothetical protein [Tepidibacter sp.]
MKDSINPLPEVLTRYDEEGGQEENRILEIVMENSKESIGIGRTKILEEYNIKFPYEKISEYRLRSIIKELEGIGYMKKQIGRRGCIITKEGIESLKEK